MMTQERFRALVEGREKGTRAALTRAAMWSCSKPYGLGMRIRNCLFDLHLKKQSRVPVPVVSVGNLTMGGTGKTPCVEYVAAHYRRQDHRVAVLSRGYGSTSGQNDEALVLEENLPDVPHLQGADRVALAETAIEELESEILILDDGFQHRRLARDLDIVLIDCLDPWGGGHVFPRGFLREPLSALARADIILLTRADQVGKDELHAIERKIATCAEKKCIVASRHAPKSWAMHGEPDRPLDAMRGAEVIAFCGIGNPRAFRMTLEALGLKVAAMREWPDHHAYRREDVISLCQWAEQYPHVQAAVTTQKDQVKLLLPKLGKMPLFTLGIGLEIISDATEFFCMLDRVWEVFPNSIHEPRKGIL